jgi:hypothetical protein
VVLGKREHKYRRTLNTAAAVEQIWRNLIAHVNSKILLEKRRADPKNQELWRLQFVDHAKQKAKGPVFEISKVGYSSLISQLNILYSVHLEEPGFGR